ncbi:hypothetical protein KP509_12G069300 [Ceratopteris richardii]|nr:hypothetical protein KP509_12G069300 [Ceratopteris richardii]
MSGALHNGAAIMISTAFPSTSPFVSLPTFGAIPLYTYTSVGSGDPSTRAFGISEVSSSHFQAQPSKLGVQLSEGRRKRFVMFDHSGTKRRIILHPEMIDGLPSLLPLNLKMGRTYKVGAEMGKESFGKATEYVVNPRSAAISPVDAVLSRDNGAHLIDPVIMNSLSFGSHNLDSSLFRIDDHGKVSAEIDHVDGCTGFSCFSHENTEDLEALLSSDEDEVSSTGHSPSDLRSVSLSANCNSKESLGMKRKKRSFDIDADDDNHSTATSGKTNAMYLSSLKVGGISDNLEQIKHRDSVNKSARRLSTYDPIGLEIFVPDDEMSSNSNRFNCRRSHSKTVPSVQQQSFGEQTKKKRIRNTLRLLRGIIPGGESMEAAFVLDEAIQYVRALQSEVHKLQAKNSLEA